MDIYFKRKDLTGAKKRSKKRNERQNDSQEKNDISESLKDIYVKGKDLSKEKERCRVEKKYIKREQLN